MSVEEFTTKDALVKLGLGKPSARCFVAGVTSAAILYFAGYPHEAFREDGTMRPFAPLTPGPDGVKAKHFLVLPLSIAACAYFFT